MNKYTFLCGMLLVLVLDCFGSETELLDSDYYSKSPTALGGIGLIQNPTARFSNDGEFAFGISTESPYHRLYAKVQIFPWLETVLKYTEGTFMPYNPGSPQTWKDKGVDLKFKLFEEGNIIPELSVGFNDFGGTTRRTSIYTKT